MTEHAAIWFQIGVQVLVVRDGRLLLGRRKGGFGAGTWGLPGGRLHKGETILQAAARELFEETGLLAGRLQVVCLGDAEPANAFQLQVGVLAETWEGEPTIREPERCDTWEFFPIENLPEPLFVSSRPLIECLRRGEVYLDRAND